MRHLLRRTEAAGSPRVQRSRRRPVIVPRPATRAGNRAPHLAGKPRLAMSLVRPSPGEACLPDWHGPGGTGNPAAGAPHAPIDRLRRRGVPAPTEAWAARSAEQHSNIGEDTTDPPQPARSTRPSDRSSTDCTRRRVRPPPLSVRFRVLRDRERACARETSNLTLSLLAWLRNLVQGRTRLGRGCRAPRSTAVKPPRGHDRPGDTRFAPRPVRN